MPRFLCRVELHCARREDSAPYAGRLQDRLSAHFGATRVFMDVDDIPPGADFTAHIRTKVASCDALIAIIGKEWLAARGPAGHSRLNDPADIVALELASALQRKILVVPVLVGGAAMPKPEELREDLRELARKNAVILHDHDFQRDVEVLIKSLEQITAMRRKADTPEQAAFRKHRERLIKRVESAADLSPREFRRLVAVAPRRIREAWIPSGYA